ncbi:VENN motif pre-toxin domain-containing protein, partial [Yersinia massiliensis]
ADKSKNSLDTGTLGFSNIENKADFKAEHQGGSLSTGGPVGSDLLSNLGSVVLSGLGNDGHADGTTQSAIADGTITIRDTDKQQQNVDDLSRDTDNANGSIGPIFDKEKEQNRLREAQLIGEIGGQAMDIARTQGDIIATKAANERMKNVTQEDIAAAEKQWAKANPDKVPTAEDINNQIYQTAYNQAFNESGLGTGGAVQRAMQAATAAVQGLAGGDMAAALANGAAPYITKLIADTLPDDPVSRTLAHAVVNAALAAAQGNNALVGAGGAVTGELIGMIALNAYGKPVSELSETEKQKVSALATLAAGLAGGLIGDSTADTVAGAQTGKTVVENNALGCSTLTCLNNPLDLSKPTLGGVGAVFGAAGGVAIADALNGDKENESGPNIGKDLTEADKAELGGTGSGTPGGLGPEDEENARSNDLVIDEKKYDYLFGNSASNPHNAARSNQLASTMENLGIYNDAGGQRILAEHFKATANTPRNVINTFSNEFGTFEVRESLLMGPSGKAARLQTTFEILPNGSRKFVTTIPK